MKILYLDNDINRLEHMRKLCSDHVLVEATTALEAIKILSEQSPFDFVSLDHDLGDVVFAPSDEKSGFMVAKFISELPVDKLPKQVVVHTWNPAGAKNMIDQLRGIVPVFYKPYAI